MIVFPERATTTGNKSYDNIIASRSTVLGKKRIAYDLTSNASTFIYSSNYADSTDSYYYVSDHYPIYAMFRDTFKIIY